MKKIAWCVPLGFVTAVIFLLGNVSTAQAATVCEWAYISVGGNEYIRQLVCYENGGEGREDVKYGTRPGSNNPREGGGGNNGAAETYKTDTLKTDRRFCIRSNDTCRQCASSTLLFSRYSSC